MMQDISSLMAEMKGLELLPFDFALFAEHPSAHFKDRFEALSASSCILAEPLHTGLFHFILDLLPPTAERGDLGLLVEICGGC